MLQALLVVPAFAIVYLVAAPTTLRRRIGALLAAGAALVVAAGWWVAIVALIPASARPYIGGSQHNSILELTLGYNGFGRLTGNETGSVGVGNRWGADRVDAVVQQRDRRPDRLAAARRADPAGGRALGDVARAAHRPDPRGPAAVGLWLLVTGLIFSFMQGIFHAYYTVALAPAVAAIVGIAATLLWRRRADIVSRSILAGTLAVTSLWAHVLLARSADFQPWLATAVPIVGVALAVLLLGVTWLPRRAALAVAVAGLITALAGPSAYAVQTAATAHTGSIVTAGPTVAGGGFGGGPGGRGGFGGPGGGGTRAFGNGPQAGTGGHRRVRRAPTAPGVAPAGTGGPGRWLVEVPEACCRAAAPVPSWSPC